MNAPATASTGKGSMLSRFGPVMLLAFSAGFVDTTGFIALFGLFTAHVTGNFVLIGASIVEHREGILGKLLALPVFVVVVALTRLFVLSCEHRKRSAASPVLLAQIAFLILFLAAGVAAFPFAGGDAPAAIVTGLLGVAAMAIQNAASRTIFAALSPTTVMTGNVTQIVIDLVDLARRAAGPESKLRLAKMWPPTVTFTLGALAGALGYLAFGFWCLFVPIGAVLLVLILHRRA